MTAPIDSKTIRSLAVAGGHGRAEEQRSVPARRPVVLAHAVGQRRSLRELLPTATFYPAGADPMASAMTADAERVTPTTLYVHLDEFDAAGAERAAGRGATAVLAERLLPGIGVPLIVVDDVRHAYVGLRSEFDKPVPTTDLFLVAGSVGRSVTAGLLSRLTRVIRRNTNEPIAVVSLDASASAVPEGPARLVCLTNARADGLTTDGRRKWQSAAEHRRAIEQTLALVDGGTTLVANADDQDCLALASGHTGALVTYGERPDADVTLTELESYPGGQEFLVACGYESGAVRVSTPGAAYRSNCGAAIATGLAAGLDLASCLAAVEDAPRPYGMLQPVICGQRFPVVLDRATRPIALRATLRAAGPAGGGRLVATIRLSRDRAISSEQLATASRLADRVIAFGGPADADRSNEIVTVVNDRDAAIAITIGLADEGDAVLVAGCTPRTLAGDRELVEGLLTRRLAHADADAAAQQNTANLT